jgi:hypothetical protein
MWRALVVVALAFVVLGGCEKILGRDKLIPGQGPLEGGTEVSISVPECGDHRKVKEVLFDTVKQNIVSQNDKEVKVRTTSWRDPATVKVFLILPNQARCETGAGFTYQKMEQSTLSYIYDRGHSIGDRRPGGWRPDLAEKLAAP